MGLGRHEAWSKRSVLTKPVVPPSTGLMVIKGASVRRIGFKPGLWREVRTWTFLIDVLTQPNGTTIGTVGSVFQLDSVLSCSLSHELRS